MKYIPDKKLYSAVMFALSMCPDLRIAKDKKIRIAADYYHVNYADVLAIVKDELWGRETKEASKNSGWYTILNYDAYDLLGTGFGNNYILICPKCGRHYSCCVDDLYRMNVLFVSRCKCGFVDEYQRKIVRKYFFEQISNTRKENTP